MKLLHTGDLHLGKNLHETPLIEDQRIMLESLEAELDRDDYAAVLIAGDVYDRTIPPAEAVELFSSFLVRLRKRHPDVRIGIIPGNHDSARRLSYADRILGEQGVHIVCDAEDSFTPIILEKNDERLALFLLPFLAPGTLKPAPARAASKPEATPELDFSLPETKLLVSQADLAAEAARRFNEVLTTRGLAGIPSALVAHCLTLGGMRSESERIFLGTAEEVPPGLFSRFSYVALGHLHRYQKVTARMYYSGSPLAYAFDESGTEKAFLKVEIDCTLPDFPVTVTPIPIHPLHTVTRLSGTFDAFYASSSFDRHASDYLEISLTDDHLITNPVNLLRPKFPFLLSLKQGSLDAADHAGIDGAANRETGPDTATRDPVADFEDFEMMLHGSVDPGRKELFADLFGKCAEEDR